MTEYLKRKLKELKEEPREICGEKGRFSIQRARLMSKENEDKAIIEVIKLIEWGLYRATKDGAYFFHYDNWKIGFDYRKHHEVIEDYFRDLGFYVKGRFYKAEEDICAENYEILIRWDEDRGSVMKSGK